MIGDKVYDHVGVLVELGLIRSRPHERTKLLSTTDRFAEYFGIDTLEPAEIRRWLADKTGIRLEKEGETIDDYEEGGDGGEGGKGGKGGDPGAPEPTDSTGGDEGPEELSGDGGDTSDK